MYRGGGDSKAVCRKIVDEMKLDRDNVQMGRTRMLYRADEHKQLELIRSIKVRCFVWCVVSLCSAVTLC